METAITNAMYNAGFKEIALQVFDSRKLLNNTSPNDSISIDSVKRDVIDVELIVGNTGSETWENSVLSFKQDCILDKNTLHYTSFIKFDSLLKIELNHSGINILYY